MIYDTPFEYQVTSVILPPTRVCIKEKLDIHSKKNLKWYARIMEKSF